MCSSPPWRQIQEEGLDRVRILLRQAEHSAPDIRQWLYRLSIYHIYQRFVRQPHLDRNTKVLTLNYINVYLYKIHMYS